MRSFEILLAWNQSLATHPSLMKIFLHGANITARVEEANMSSVLRDLATAVVELSDKECGKRIIRFYEDAHELVIERVGSLGLVSLYKGGSEPSVVVYDREVMFCEIVSGTLEAVRFFRETPASGRRPRAEAREEWALLEARLQVEFPRFESTPPPEVQTAGVEIGGESPLSFGAEFAIRTRSLEASPPSKGDVEMADLHALLFSGQVKADVRGRVVELGVTYRFCSQSDSFRLRSSSWRTGATAQFDSFVPTQTEFCLAHA